MKEEMQNGDNLDYRKEADFINERYGIGDEDHDTALEKGHIYDLMRAFASYNVTHILPEDTVIRDKAIDMDEKDFERWWWETVYKNN